MFLHHNSTNNPQSLSPGKKIRKNNVFDIRIQFPLQLLGIGGRISANIVSAPLPSPARLPIVLYGGGEYGPVSISLIYCTHLGNLTTP